MHPMKFSKLIYSTEITDLQKHVPLLSIEKRRQAMSKAWDIGLLFLELFVDLQNLNKLFLLTSVCLLQGSSTCFSLLVFLFFSNWDILACNTMYQQQLAMPCVVHLSTGYLYYWLLLLSVTDLSSSFSISRAVDMILEVLIILIFVILFIQSTVYYIYSM